MFLYGLLNAVKTTTAVNKNRGKNKLEDTQRLHTSASGLSVGLMDRWWFFFGLMDGWAGGWVYVGLMVGWVCGWMGWMDGWVDGWMDRSINQSVNSCGKDSHEPKTNVQVLSSSKIN